MLRISAWPASSTASTARISPKFCGDKGCGEVRFIYRLAYAFKKKGKRLASRLPVDFNAVYSVAPDADGGCTGVAGRWQPQLDEAVDAGWLAGGPIDPSELSFKQLELNAQVVRFPSGQETEFGGQAAYLMRIFGIDGDTVTEKGLENTPDTARLAADAALKDRLADYVRANTAAIDVGVYEVPDEFLARKVISWSTFGSIRRANHPFTETLPPESFADLDFASLGLVKSPQALIERLDNGTCQGCHQAGSTAGFHFIGRDDKSTSPLNRIEVGVSPHFHAEQPRRAAWLMAMAEERVPAKFRPLSFAPPADWGAGQPQYQAAGVAMPCMTEDDAKGFAGGWSCGQGTVCTPIASATGTSMQLAQCLLPPKSEAMFSGHPCLTGAIATNQSQPFNDRMKITGQFAAFAPAYQPHRLQLPAAEDRRSGRARLPRLRRQGSQLRRLQAGQADAQRDLRTGRRQEVRHLRCHQQFRPVPRRRGQPRQPPGLLGRPFLPRGLYVPGAAARHARHRQGEGHRLLLADLLHLPDAHRQPHHAVGERADGDGGGGVWFGGG